MCVVPQPDRRLGDAVFIPKCAEACRAQDEKAAIDRLDADPSCSEHSEKMPAGEKQKHPRLLRARGSRHDRPELRLAVATLLRDSHHEIIVSPGVRSRFQPSSGLRTHRSPIRSDQYQFEPQVRSRPTRMSLQRAAEDW